MIKKIVVIVALASVLPIMTACDQNEVAALVSTLGSASASIAQAEGNSSLAAQLKNDTASAVTTIQNWKHGDDSTTAVEALDIVEADLHLFPVTDVYAPLINLAINTGESIISIVHPTASVAHTSVSTPKNAQEFKKSWNQIVTEHPEMSKVKIK